MTRRSLIWIIGLSLPVFFVIGVWAGGDDAGPEAGGMTSTSIIPTTTSQQTTMAVVSTSTTSPTATSSPATTAGSSIPSRDTGSVSVPADWQVARIVEVIDGDTIEVRFEDGTEDTVRLIGINSPEGGECFAVEATTGLTELIADETVLLEPDQSNRDQFGRLLRYVWTTDEQFVNSIMVEEDWALSREYPPDTARANQLAEGQQMAQDEGAGIWAANACGTAIPADIQIAYIEYDAPGDDNFNLNGEWVEIVNGDDTAVDLTGWTLKDESATHRYEFPVGFTLEPGASVQIYTGCGQDSVTSLYWCNSGSAVWNNSGDTAFLLDPSGNIVFSYAYG